jgi:enhancing lycopene biosynthesis protein 2
MKKIAVVLCGSGFKDGSEIRESVATLWALSQEAVEVQCFAPNLPQKEVVNCLTGETVAGESRNMLVEAARIARGKVRPLAELAPAEWDALVIPGGFGVAKNLCTFAFEGSRGHVLAGFENVLRATHAARKPIGAICIAPAALALAFPHVKLQLTLGAAGEAAEEIQKLGHRHEVRAANEICIDEAHRIVSTPAYMHADAPLHEIFTGIQKLVRQVVRWA